MLECIRIGFPYASIYESHYRGTSTESYYPWYSPCARTIEESRNQGYDYQFNMTKCDTECESGTCSYFNERACINGEWQRCTGTCLDGECKQCSDLIYTESVTSENISERIDTCINTNHYYAVVLKGNEQWLGTCEDTKDNQFDYEYLVDVRTCNENDIEQILINSGYIVPISTDPITIAPIVTPPISSDPVSTPTVPSVADSEITNQINSCQEINESSKLNSNITIQTPTIDCLNIIEDNIIIDCQGYKITAENDYTSFNPILGVPWTAIKINNHNNITIKNCQIEYFRNAIGIKNSEEIVIYNNKIDSDKEEGYGDTNLDRTIAIKIEDSKEIFIINNSLYNAESYAISSTSESIRIIGNNIKANKESIIVTGEDNLIENNIFYNNSRKGVHIRGRNNTIVKNNVFDNFLLLYYFFL
jgi:parallel beta-helix repeat protein